MTVEAVIGVDIGTSSTKGVLVGLDGRVIGRASREHTVDRPCPELNRSSQRGVA